MQNRSHRAMPYANIFRPFRAGFALKGLKPPAQGIALRYDQIKEYFV